MTYYDFVFWAVLGLVLGTVFGSFFEWTLHRFLMHRRWPGFGYPFERHTLIHHRVFRADSSYHLHDPADKHTVPMAWWNGPALIAITQLPFVAVAWWAGHWALLCGSVVAAVGYYAAYEYIHWCMHIPRKRTVERSGLFFRLNGHHLLHHRYMGKNFNVVLPLADLLLGTLLRRAPVQFAQARGPFLPDVQPRGR